MTRYIRRPFAAVLPALLLALPLLLGAFACSPSADTASMNVDDPADLGTVAARIERDPKRADEVLSEAGVTEEELRAAIERTARAPEASRAYREAFEAELGRELGEEPADE